MLALTPIDDEFANVHKHAQTVAQVWGRSQHGESMGSKPGVDPWGRYRGIRSLSRFAPVVRKHPIGESASIPLMLADSRLSGLLAGMPAIPKIPLRAISRG